MDKELPKQMGFLHTHRFRMDSAFGENPNVASDDFPYSDFTLKLSLCAKLKNVVYKTKKHQGVCIITWDFLVCRHYDAGNMKHENFLAHTHQLFVLETVSVR